MLTLNVSGMTCGHCESAVTNAVRSAGGGEVSVDLGRGSVTVGGNPDRAAIIQAIAAAGYEVGDGDAMAATPRPGAKACGCGSKT